MIFGTDMSSLGHIDNEKKDNLIIGKGPIDGLEKEYSIDFTEQEKNSCFNFHYNGMKVIYLRMVLKYINSKQRILK